MNWQPDPDFPQPLAALLYAPSAFVALAAGLAARGARNGDAGSGGRKAMAADA